MGLNFESQVYKVSNMADPNQTPQQGDWVCPCTGCTKSRKKALRQVFTIINATGDINYNMHELREFLRGEKL